MSAPPTVDDMTAVAAWLIDCVGYPFDFTFPQCPPPTVLRAAIVDHAFRDPTGRVHGGDLDRDGVAALIADEAGWSS